MTLKFLSLAILSLLAVGGSAQTPVKYNDITFRSDIEKKALDDFFVRHTTDHFSLFMANGQLLTDQASDAARTRFSNFIDAEKAKIQAKKESQKIKLLHDDVHKTFLAKYETPSKFEQIFYSGGYDCVTSTALYAIALEKLGIPYTIKEKPDHVYLIAYPDVLDLVVETTLPSGTNAQPTPVFKANFVSTLKQQKLISAADAARQSTDELFNKYYYGNDANITLIQLIGIHYMNAGTVMIGNGLYLDALHEFEKAYMFYPQQRLEVMLMYCAFQVFSNTKRSEPVHAVMLSKMAQYRNAGIKDDMIMGEYNRVIDDLLFQNGNEDALQAYQDTLKSLIENPSLQTELTFLHNYERARYHYNAGNFKESLRWFDASLSIKPNHQEAMRNLMGSLFETMRSKPNNEFVQAVESYATKIPTLLKNNKFIQLTGEVYLRQLIIEFESNKPTAGEQVRTKFERLVTDYPDAAVDQYLLGNAYSAAAVYYFRKNQTAKARTIIAKGLEISPNNYELETRKRMIQ